MLELFDLQGELSLLGCVIGSDRNERCKLVYDSPIYWT